MQPVFTSVAATPKFNAASRQSRVPGGTWSFPEKTEQLNKGYNVTMGMPT
jgi:hypothetical protein